MDASCRALPVRCAGSGDAMSDETLDLGEAGLRAIEKRIAPEHMHGRETIAALIAEVRRLRARESLPVINECRICKWCVGFGNVSRKTQRFVGTWHCEHPDAPKDEGSTGTDGKGGSSWSRPMATDPNAAPPSACPLRTPSRPKAATP